MVEKMEQQGSGKGFEESRYDVVVVGGGIGGLACAALLVKEGMKVLVVERQPRAGGYVTAYERKGYLFQVPHLMAGCGPDGDITRIANHLGLDVQFKKVDPYQRYIYPDHDIFVHSDIDTYVETLKDNFQPQTESIHRFFSRITGIHRAMDVRMMRRPMGPGTAVTMALYPILHPRFCSCLWGGKTFSELLDKFFTENKLRSVLSTPWYLLGSPPWEISALSMIGMMMGFADGAYFPIGGFGRLADAFVEVFESNGGTLLLDHEVSSINAEDGKVTGVEMIPRAKSMAEYVVSDVDTGRTFMRLVNRENLTVTFLDRLAEQEFSTSGLVVHLGMAKSIEDEDVSCPILAQSSYSIKDMLEEVSSITDYPDPANMCLGMMIPSIQDPSLAPEGKSCMDVLVPGVPYKFKMRWGVEEGGHRGQKYNSIKEKYAEVAVEAATKFFPHLISDVEAFDVSTPITYERYTMAIDGCWYDCAQVPGQVLGKRLGPKTPIRGLYLTGAKSALGGGIYSSIMNGLLAADSILKGKLSHLF